MQEGVREFRQEAETTRPNLIRALRHMERLQPPGMWNPNCSNAGTMGPTVSRKIGKLNCHSFSSWEQNKGCHHVPVDVIKIPTMSPSANKETIAFLGFGNVHVPGSY